VSCSNTADCCFHVLSACLLTPNDRTATMQSLICVNLVVLVVYLHVVPGCSTTSVECHLCG